MAESPSKTAKVALAISILTACFSIFQWWNTEKEARISAAIDVSRNYYKDLNLPQVHALMKAYVGGDLSHDELQLFVREADYLNYIAKLANENKLDKTFLSRDIHCAMLLTLQAHDNDAKWYDAPVASGLDRPDLRKFAQSIDCPYKAILDSYIAAIAKAKATKPP
jgi:hypothetical protein